MGVVSLEYNHFPLSHITSLVPPPSVSYSTLSWLTSQFLPPLLHEVRKLCRHSKWSSLVYKELREHLDRLSLFVGRNPLVSSVAVL